MTMKPGRNDPCPCGSGRKYKQCHGAVGAAVAPGVARHELDALAAMIHARRLGEAEQRLQALLVGHPNDGRLWKFLSVALVRQGKEALPALRRAAQLLPEDAEAHANLGAALHDSGQWEAAVASLRRSLDLEPRNPGALIDAANALRALGHVREAIPLYHDSLELDPHSAEAHTKLGNACLELRRIADAEAAYRHALALQVAHLPAHLGLAAVLRLRGRHDEAEASCQAALSVSPPSAATLSLLGELRADRGHFAEAQELFQRAIALEPDFASAFCSIAEHRRMTDADSAWRQGAEALLAKALPLGQQISLRYALGKYFDDVGEYDAAFRYYREANELGKRYGASYDRAQLTRRVDEMIGTFDAPFIRECQRDASASELPVFIVGMPRSGTSLTEQILASHPAVFGAGELRFWDDGYAALEKAGLRSARAPRLIARIGRDYLERLSGLSPGSALRVIDKMPANFLYAGLIHATFPRARIIHVLRHPIDTCLSIYFQNFLNMGPYANDFDNLAHYYRQYQRVTAHWRGLLAPGVLLEIPYEELVAGQELWTRRMLEFLGLPWEPRCLEFHRTERVVITASRWQVRQRIHSGSAGRWRNYQKHTGPLLKLLEP